LASELIARRIIFTGGAGNFYVFLLHPMNYRRILPLNMIYINRFGYRITAGMDIA
jgi:hypothetical protein